MPAMTTGRVLAGLFLVLAIYCGLDPFNQSSISGLLDFQAHMVDVPSWSQVPLEKDPENLLQKSEIRFLNQVDGPESIAFDPQGRGPYTGLADGRIVFWDGHNWSDFAYTSPNSSRSKLCAPKSSSALSNLEDEEVCGRPLGLRFEKKTGDLYIADAYFGLMKVGREGGLAVSLATEAEGIPFGFTNDLDIDDQGNIYFTDSSVKYQRRDFLLLIFSADDSGRVLKYNATTRETTVVIRRLQFPNGISLSKDMSYFVFCEGSAGRLRKYWVKGERAGTSQVMAILPGFPDNVRTNEEGEFWVAVHARRSLYAYLCGMYPRVRLFLLKLPIPAKIQYLLHIGGRQHALVVKYSQEGEVVQILEDRQGRVVRAVSEVEEKDGKLWMGSVLMPFVAVYNLS